MPIFVPMTGDELQRTRGGDQGFEAELVRRAGFAVIVGNSIRLVSAAESGDALGS